MNATSLDLSQIRTDALGSAPAFRRLIDVDLLIGKGNLYHYFERQYNAASGRVLDANYRVGIMHCGDSLAERLCGWISIYAEKDYPDNQGRGLGNTTFNLTGPPNDTHVASGVLGDSTGDASRLDNRYDLWPDGFVYDLGSTGIVTFPPRRLVTLTIYGDDPRPFTTIKVAYIAASGQGSFDIETSPDGMTWTKQGATVNSSNASTIGAITTRTVTEGVYHVRIKHVSGGRCKVVGIYTGFAKTVAGFEAFAMSRGGTTPSEWSQTPLAIVTPILTELDPALVTWHCADSLQEYEDHFDDLMAISRAGNPDRSVLWIASHSYDNEGADAETTSIQQFLRSKVDLHKIALFDLRELTGPYADIVSAGWQGDGVHMDQLLYAYGYSVLEQMLPIINPMTRRFDVDSIDNLPQLFANQNEPFGLALNDIDDFGVRYVTSGGPNSEQGTCMTFGLGPAPVYSFSAFAVQLFIPAFSANGLLYKRERDAGTWSAWDEIGGGSVDLSAYLTTSTAASTYQPLDSDLTAISALTTTATGRGLLTESVTPTGTGALMRAASPTTTGTLTAAAITASGIVSASHLQASSAADIKIVMRASDSVCLLMTKDESAFRQLQASTITSYGSFSINGDANITRLGANHVGVGNLTASGTVQGGTVVVPYTATGTERYVNSAFANFGRQFGMYVEADGNEGGFKANSVFTLKGNAINCLTGSAGLSISANGLNSRLVSNSSNLELGSAGHLTQCNGNLTASGTVAARNLLTIGTAQTASFTAVEGTLHPINLSGVGADLTITMPATPTTNGITGVYITHTSATYEAVWNRNGNTMRRGTTVSAFPLWAVGEFLIWQWDGGDWVLIEDGRAMESSIYISNSTSGFTSGLQHKAPMSASSDPFAMGGTNEIIPRRTGVFAIRGFMSFFSGILKDCEIGLHADAIGNVIHVTTNRLRRHALFQTYETSMQTEIQVNWTDLTKAISMWITASAGSGVYYTAADIAHRLEVRRVG